jgi:F420-0:gamma-glutamyl ligase-like protein
VRTRYWKPGTDYVREIINATKDIVENGDIITVSEKAVSTALGLLVDESNIEPGSLAKLLVTFWTRKIWAKCLGRLTKMRQNTLVRLINFPMEEGAAHKQVALQYTNILQALRHYSEGGIDATNLPYSYVSLALPKPDYHANRIKNAFKDESRIVTVIIVDGDTTYTWRNLHLSPRTVPVKGLFHFGGFLTFVAGRMMSFKSRSTPVAFVGEPLNPDWILTLANIAHRIRGHGAGRTVWDMIKMLDTDLKGVTWEMLEEIKHYPIVIIRKIGEID